MAQFSKWNQPKHRGGGRPLDPNSKAGQKRAEQARKAREESAKAFEKFETAESGCFNGFEFVEEFHSKAKYNKAYALEVLTADDCADVVTSTGAKLHTSIDGCIAYVMTESARNGDAKKRVDFNRSVYFF